MQLQAVRRGTWEENHGTLGVPRSRAKGGPLWGALFEERKGAREMSVRAETGEPGMGFYFINTCSVHWLCQAPVCALLISRLVLTELLQGRYYLVLPIRNLRH